MNACEKYINKVKDLLPDLATSKELVKFGIFKSEQAASNSRKRNEGPEFFKFNERTILYPKEAVIDYMKRSMSSEVLPIV